jgi:hypothetical protein
MKWVFRLSNSDAPNQSDASSSLQHLKILESKFWYKAGPTSQQNYTAMLLRIDKRYILSPKGCATVVCDNYQQKHDIFVQEFASKDHQHSASATMRQPEVVRKAPPLMLRSK